MTTSELMKALADAGAPFEAILIAVKAVEEKDAEIARRDAEAGEKRAKDAERKRIERGSTLVHGQSTDSPVTVQAVSETDIPETEASYRVTPVTPKGVTAPTGAKRNRGMKIGEDWAAPSLSELGPEFRTLAEQWTDASYRTEAAAFRSYWLAETGVKASKSNWKRAWENRIAQIHGKVMREQRFARPPPANSGNDLVSSILGKQQAHAP